MTLVEKMRAGEVLSEEELRRLATSYDRRFRYIRPIDPACDPEAQKDSMRCMQPMQTILTIGSSLWCIPWKCGFTEDQKSEFFEQPYRVARKKRVVTQVYYEKIEEDIMEKGGHHGK